MNHTLDQQTIEEMKEVLLRRLPERMDIDSEAFALVSMDILCEVKVYFAIQICTIMQRKVQNFASSVLVFRQRMRDTITVTCEV